jgi:hypothetical protein
MLANASSYDRIDSNLDGTANIKNIIESIPSLSTLSSYFNVLCYVSVHEFKLLKFTNHYHDVCASSTYFRIQNNCEWTLNFATNMFCICPNDVLSQDSIEGQSPARVIRKYRTKLAQPTVEQSAINGQQILVPLVFFVHAVVSRTMSKRLTNRLTWWKDLCTEMPLFRVLWTVCLVSEKNKR